MEQNTRNIQQNSPAQGKTNNDKHQPDASTMNDSATHVANEKPLQGGLGREIFPEHGDAADPTSEELGQHHRDE